MICRRVGRGARSDATGRDAAGSDLVFDVVTLHWNALSVDHLGWLLTFWLFVNADGDLFLRDFYRYVCHSTRPHALISTRLHVQTLIFIWVCSTASGGLNHLRLLGPCIRCEWHSIRPLEIVVTLNWATLVVDRGLSSHLGWLLLLWLFFDAEGDLLLGPCDRCVCHSTRPHV